jgi:hypothetical protein
LDSEAWALAFFMRSFWLYSSLASPLIYFERLVIHTLAQKVKVEKSYNWDVPHWTRKSLKRSFWRE